jgi:hypothetical protein
MGILLFLLKLQPTLYPRYASSIFLYIVDMSQTFFHAPLTSNAKLTRFFVRDSKIYKCVIILERLLSTHLLHIWDFHVFVFKIHL